MLVAVVLATSADTGTQRVEDRDGLLERDARVGDGHAVLEGGRALDGDLLVALVDVGLDHDAHDHVGVGLVGRQLRGNVVADLDLLDVLLRAVAVRAVDHDAGVQAGLGELLASGENVLGGIVGALGRAAQDHVGAVVAVGLDNGRDTLLGDRQEGVAGSSGLDGVEGNVDRAVLRDFLSAQGYVCATADRACSVRCEQGPTTTTGDSKTRGLWDVSAVCRRFPATLEEWVKCALYVGDEIVAAAVHP